MSTTQTSEQINKAYTDLCAARSEFYQALDEYTAESYDPNNPFAHLLAYLKKRAQAECLPIDFDDDLYDIEYTYLKVNPPILCGGCLRIGHEGERPAVRVQLPDKTCREHLRPEFWDWPVESPAVVADGAKPYIFIKEQIYGLFEQWVLSQI